MNITGMCMHAGGNGLAVWRTRTKQSLLERREFCYVVILALSPVLFICGDFGPYDTFSEYQGQKSMKIN